MSIAIQGCVTTTYEASVDKNIRSVVISSNQADLIASDFVNVLAEIPEGKGLWKQAVK